MRSLPVAAAIFHQQGRYRQPGRSAAILRVAGAVARISPRTSKEGSGMLPREENELITRVGQGTAMGNMMRRYWIPALLDEIAEPDGPPVRVRLLGEDLVAFRDTEGRIGLLDEYCPHRRASLWFGRNEECGLRCVYHGWKFDVAGSCVDQLNEPAEHQFTHKVHIPAYPTVELGGIVGPIWGRPSACRRRRNSLGPRSGRRTAT
jgi:nitrite reductase/ring-hydroxylating ferredoxin subunit